MESEWNQRAVIRARSLNKIVWFWDLCFSEVNIIIYPGGSKLPLLKVYFV